MNKHPYSGSMLPMDRASEGRSSIECRTWIPVPPIESVPALIVVAPVYVFVPERVWVPDDNVNLPVPDITPE